MTHNTKNILEKNFAPLCFEETPISWNENELLEIQAIRENLNFNPNYDLHNHLAQLSVDSESLKQLDRQKPTPSEALAFLKKLNQMTSEANECVTTILKSLAAFDELRLFFEKAGTSLTSEIANNRRENYELINSFRDTLDFFDFNNAPSLYFQLEQLKAITNKIPALFTIAEGNLPKIKAGAPKKPYLKGLIQLLMKIFADGTNEPVTCGWTDTSDEFTENADVKGKYTGKFYDFLICVKPLIEPKLNISMGKNNNLGKLTREILTELNNNPS